MSAKHVPLEIFCLSRCSIPKKTLQRAVAFLYKTERVPSHRTVSLVFCSDRKIRRINCRFRGIDRATDVLSFRFDDDDLLGEIYLSPRRAFRQAHRYGWTYRQEVLRLFIHGFYHLIGYEHKTEKESMAMCRKELSAAAGLNCDPCNNFCANQRFKLY